MITADTLQTLITFTTPALSRAVQLAGYTDPEFTSSSFLGLTNAGQYCYKVSYHDESRGGAVDAKVFLTYDPVLGSVTADW